MSLVLLLVLAQIADPARARIDEAKQQLRDLKYKEAGRTLEAIALRPGLTKAEALEFYTLDGLMKAGLNDAAGARRSFGFAILLDPELKLPGKPAPRVSTPFLEAKAWAREHAPLEVTLRSKELGPDHWVLQFAVPPAEAGLSDKVLFTVVEGGVSRQAQLPVALADKLDAREGRTQVSWQLLDARGWVLHEGGPLTLEPRVVRTDAPIETRPPVALLPPEKPRVAAPLASAPRKRLFSWISLGAAGLGSIAAVSAGIVTDGTATDLRARVHSRSQADLLVLQILGQSTFTNIAWVFTGAALITSIIFFIVESRP